MPAIYISPSVREFNPYIIGGSEEFYMNRIADAMVPYLRASGIGFSRNNPGISLSQIMTQANSRRYDLHMALHSGSSPENMQGVLQGPDVYYYTTSDKGKRAADIFAENLKTIYPNPSLVMAIPTTILAELRKTKAPAVLVQIAYHDNHEDATWIRDKIDAIGKNLSLSVAQYLGVPFSEPRW